MSSTSFPWEELPWQLFLIVLGILIGWILTWVTRVIRERYYARRHARQNKIFWAGFGARYPLGQSTWEFSSQASVLYMRNTGPDRISELSVTAGGVELSQPDEIGPGEVASLEFADEADMSAFNAGDQAHIAWKALSPEGLFGKQEKKAGFRHNWELRGVREFNILG